MSDMGINIKLGDNSDKSEKHEKRKCSKGPCPPTFMETVEEIGGYLPIIFGTVLTGLKMDQFTRPLVNTASEMLGAMPPQIEHNGEKITEIVNGITKAQHNLKNKITKTTNDFTVDDRAHLIQLLINDDTNYIDSYESAMTFIKETNPGLIRAIYTSLVANKNKNNAVIHGENRQAIETLNSQRDHDRYRAQKRWSSGADDEDYWNQMDREKDYLQRDIEQANESETVKNIKKGASTAKKKIGEGARAVGEGARAVGKSASDAGKSALDAIKQSRSTSQKGGKNSKQSRKHTRKQKS